MCGIAGLFSLNESQISREKLLWQMLDKVKHRGPDSDGVVSFNAGSLGHVRLAIRDLTPLGSQPMLTEDGRHALVYNGELYNTEELSLFMFEKHSWSAKGRSDTELLLGLLVHEGIQNTLSKIKGMFSFAFFDSSSGDLFLARDQLGIKPLYYTHSTNGLIAFSSEFKGLAFDTFTSGKICKQSVASLLERNYISSPNTLYENIFKLEAGHYLEIKIENDITLYKHKYYALENSSNENSSKQLTADSLDSLLRDTVKKHLLSDVEVGCFLSGGVDSSLIASYASQQMDSPLKTFTISFDEGEYDESKVAERIAKHLQSEHTTFQLSTDYMEEHIADILDEMDEPFADSSFIPTYIVSKLASEHVKVCLSGDGGDEAFLGYDKYRSYPKALNSVARTSSFIKYLPKWCFGERISNFLPFNNALDKLDKLQEILATDDLKKRTLIVDSFWHSPPLMLDYEPHEYSLIDASISEPIEMVNELDIKYYLPDDLLVKSDISSMRHSLELRVPFLYLDVFESGIKASRQLKVNESQGKLVLRELQQRYLPKDISQMPKKGFRVPLAEWIRGALKEFSRDRIDVCLSQLSFLDEDAVNDKWDLHQEFKGDYSYWLWSLICLGHWLIANRVTDYDD